MDVEVVSPEDRGMDAGGKRVAQQRVSTPEPRRIEVVNRTMGFTLYYHLVGRKNANRPSGLWRKARQFCLNLDKAFPDTVAKVTSTDGSVYFVRMKAGVEMDLLPDIATDILLTLAKALPLIPGDRLVASVPVGGGALREIIISGGVPSTES